jgi:DNA-binding XRE family transcriptional regulator
MSLCDEPAQLFKAVPKEIFIAHWPSIRREWKRTQHSLDFLYWWDAIYQNLNKNQGTVLSGEGSRQLRFIGGQIRSARLKKEWSQDDVAARIKMDQRKISAVENGQSNITMETLLKITWAVGLNKIEFDFSN